MAFLMYLWANSGLSDYKASSTALSKCPPIAYAITVQWSNGYPNSSSLAKTYWISN